MALSNWWQATMPHKDIREEWMIEIVGQYTGRVSAYLVLSGTPTNCAP